MRQKHDGWWKKPAVFFILRKDMKLRLVRPNDKYLASFLAAWEESKNEKRYQLYHQELTNPEGYIKKQKGLPNTKWWWIIEKEEYIGRMGIRRWGRASGDVVIELRPSKRGQGYGKKAGGLIKHKARSMKKKELTFICRKSNLASQKMIENWGGKLERELRRKRKEIRLSYCLSI